MKYFKNISGLRRWQLDAPEDGDTPNRANIPLQERPLADTRNPMRVLVCHDYKGGYKPYERSQGIFTSETEYTLEYPHLISTFVYFSHYRVTIPPASWTNMMHRNGVRMLGTLIFEHGSRTELDSLLEKDEDGKFIFVQKLVDIADYYGFDGWLLNLETTFTMETFNLHILTDFIKELRNGCLMKLNGGEVVWYDSLTGANIIQYQNGLGLPNLPFFQVASGLFTNYWWNPLVQLPISLALSAPMLRNRDVYMGIDVFGRGTYAGGQWKSGIALEAIKTAGLSAAIFAPGWVFENFGGENFEMRNRKFWVDGTAADIELICRPVAEFSTAYEAGTKEVFYTNFNRGYGKKWSQNGRDISTKAWVHVGAQALLPTFYTSRTDQLVWSLDDRVVYDGGHSLRIDHKPGGNSKLSCSLYKLGMTYINALSLNFSYILSAANKGRVAIYFNLQLSNGVIERHEVGLPVQDEWGIKTVTLDVGKSEEEGFGVQLVELGVAYIAPEVTSDTNNDPLLRLGHIGISGYPLPKLPSIGKVVSNSSANGNTSLKWALNYDGFSPAELSQKGIKSKITGEFVYFIVYKGLGEYLGISHCLEFHAAGQADQSSTYRVDGVAWDGRVVKGAWF